MSKTFKLDTTDQTFLAASVPKVLTDRITGAQRLDREGKPIYFLDALLVGDSTETIRVRSKLIEPSITAGVPIELKGASIMPWTFNGKSGLTFYADAIDVKGSATTNKTN